VELCQEAKGFIFDSNPKLIEGTDSRWWWVSPSRSAHHSLTYGSTAAIYCGGGAAVDNFNLDLVRIDGVTSPSRRY